MNLGTAISQVIILFIIMLIGFVARKRNVINESIQNSFSTLLMKIALPALVLSSSKIIKNNDILPNIISIFYITLISYILIILTVSFLTRILKLNKSISNVFISLIVFANVGFMGYPVARALFGNIGVFYASIANLVFSLFLWTYGILLYNSKDKIKLKNLANIGSISALVSIIMFLTNIRLPFVMQSALEHIGKMTTPLAMLLIGSLITEVPIKAIFTDWKVILISFIKLLFIPLTTALTLKLLSFNYIVISICTIMAVMPSGATNAIFAKEFNSEPAFASIGVFVTTLLSIGAIPFIIYILNGFIL